MTDHDEARVFNRSIDVLVARLRHKLKAPGGTPPLIETIRGRGYRLKVPVAWEPPAGEP